MYYPPLSVNQDWSNAPPPGERSDHGSPGHGLFLGSVADAIDMPPYSAAYLPVYAISDLSIYEKWFHYSSADGQPYGWVAKCKLSDGRRIVYAHLQSSPAKDSYAKGEQIDIISDILNYDHLHFEMEGVVAGDMPFLFAIPKPKIELEVEDMGLGIEKAEPIGDGWYFAGWFTKVPPWKCDILVVAKTSLTDVEVYYGDRRQGIYNMGKFNADQARSVPGDKIPGDGTIWLRPVGGEILRATVRTYK